MNIDLDALKRHPAVLELYRARVRMEREMKEWVGRCPFHPDHNPSFHVHEYQGAWLWNCFGCKKTGNIFHFISEIDHISMKEAIHKVKDSIANQLGQTTKVQVDRVFKPLAPRQDAIAFLLSDYSAFEKNLENSDEAKRWLQERWISYDTARKLHFGFRQDVGKLAGQQNQDIADKGWIVLPCVHLDKVLSIKYRSIVRKEY